MKTTQAVIDAILEVALQIGFTGQNWPRLRTALNDAKVTTRRGGSWNSIQALEQFCHRNGVKFTSQEAPASETQVGDTQREQAEQLELVASEMQDMTVEEKLDAPEAPNQPIHPAFADNLPLMPDEIAGLREMLAAWKDQRTVPISAREQPTYRPAFPGERANSGIRINQRLLRAALEKAKTEDATLTGGGKLSPLIEHLLWGYLKYDPKFLKP